MLSSESIPAATKSFTKENLDECLKTLAKAYRKTSGRHAKAEIVLIGGAAILVGYDFREMTTDVDAIIRADSSIKTAINLVGDELGLPNGWLNMDFTKTSSYSPKLSQYSRYYRTYGGVVDVRVISGEYLIAMKMVSFRPYKKDQSDILGVLLYHKNAGTPIRMEQIKAAVTDLYESEDVVSKEAEVFVEKAVNCDNLSELFSEIIQAEQDAKELLVSFEEDYKDVLNSDNLNEILAVLREKQEGKK